MKKTLVSILAIVMALSLGCVAIKQTSSIESSLKSSEIKQTSSIESSLESSEKEQSSLAASSTSVEPGHWFTDINTANLKVTQIYPKPSDGTVSYSLINYTEEDLVGSAAFIAKGTIVDNPIKFTMQFNDEETGYKGSAYASLYQFKVSKVYKSDTEISEGDIITISYCDYQLRDNISYPLDGYVSLDSNKEYVLFAHDEAIESRRTDTSDVNKKYFKMAFDYYLLDGYRPIISVEENNEYGFSRVNSFLITLREGKESTRVKSYFKYFRIENFDTLLDEKIKSYETKE